MDQKSVQKGLNSSFWRVETVEKTGSTNEDLFLRAKAGEKEGAVLIAETQDRGKGRGENKFYSPAGAGLYLSFLLDRKEETDLSLTVLSGVCAAEAIEAVLPDKRVYIKWVNDLYEERKKVCGILAQSGSRFDGSLFAVVGVGINVYAPKGGFGAEAFPAGALTDQKSPADLREKIACELLNRIERRDNYPVEKLLREYRARDYLKGKSVVLSDGARAAALGIADDFSLILRLEDGSLRRVFSGEARVLRWEKP